MKVWIVPKKVPSKDGWLIDYYDVQTREKMSVVFDHPLFSTSVEARTWARANNFEVMDK